MPFFVRGTLLFAIVSAALPARAADPVKLSGGLVTTPALDANPPSVRVNWIKWDSGFRGSGLQPGDRIVAINGKALERPAEMRELQRATAKSIGGLQEHERWAEAGLAEGASVTLTVKRRPPGGTGIKTLDVKGTLRAEVPFIKDATGARALSPDGPPERAKDGFSSEWSTWYESQVKLAIKVLDGGWQAGSFGNRYELGNHLAEKARVEALVQKYPGPFATAVKEDWERVRVSLAGTAYTINPQDLEYRSLGDQRAAEVAKQVAPAREAFLQQHAAEIMEPFPVIDPVKGDRDKVKGKLVVLPAGRSFASEAGHAWMTSGDSKRGWYFMDCEGAAMQRMFGAMYRYKVAVSPKIGESYGIVARVTGEPRLLVISGRATPGLLVEPVGATIGEALFVDLTVVKDKIISPFAGEEALRKLGGSPPPTQAEPKQVMEAFFSALKVGQDELWMSMYSTWRTSDWGNGKVMYYPSWPRKLLKQDWIRARRVVLDKVYDVRVVWLGEVRRIMTGKEFPHAPVIDEVELEVDHVGKFDGEYRSFKDLNVNRGWVLQRIDGGPWRVVSNQAL